MQVFPLSLSMLSLYPAELLLYLIDSINYMRTHRKVKKIYGEGRGRLVRTFGAEGCLQHNVQS